MHTFREVAKAFEVGYWLHVDAGNEWVKLCTVSYKIQAVTMVNFLNGGSQEVELIDEMIKQEGDKYGE